MFVKKIGLSVFGIALLAGGILTGCSEDEAGSSTQKASAETKKEAKKKQYNIGDTISAEGLKIKLSKASYTSPAEFADASKGKVLTIELNVENNSNDSALIDNTDFNLYDKDGNQLDEYFGYDDLAISGDINKGKKKSGKLYYDVPKADSYELIYKPSFSWGDKEYKINVKPQ
ncbi:DUF4352 domain-containing protein [Bacillus velezensis]|uniref:DUF4352 domain-containing protein n=1 Tax=Bacillus velezensis TaxID=492670 RepID=UPI003F6E31DD